MKLETPVDTDDYAQLLWNTHQPLRAEPFSIDHLEQHCRQLAERHAVDFTPHSGRRLDERLTVNSRRIRLAYDTISEAVRDGEPITPDAEWLIDNFYVVEDQLREIFEDLPPGFYFELPKIEQGPLQGVPRVYLLAVELLAHTDSELDDEMLARCVLAYQHAAPLTIGELWAVPIMLRLGLVENLRRLAEQALELRSHRTACERVIDSWIKEGELHFGEPSPVDTPAFALQLVERIRDAGPDFDECLARLEQRLAKHDLVVDDLIRREQQRQAANQVSIGNVITSMRLLTALDWSVFFERTSLVDVELRRDPSGCYRRLEFDTRDRYRHVIEELAKRSEATEVDVARLTVEFAQAAAHRDGEPAAAAHVGYYLIGPGRARVEQRLGYRPKLGQRARRWIKRRSGSFYFGALSLLTALFVAAPAAYAWWYDASWAAMLGTALLTLVPASELALGILNYWVTRVVKPRALPKLDFVDAIPPEYQTVIVIPALLTSLAECRSLLDRIELHYLANPQAGLYFALLTDFPDAPTQHQPDDERLLDQMLEGIAHLNLRYGTEERPEPFYFFHRERRWNEVEGKWMGWERKRGKLLEFNHLIRGANTTSFTIRRGVWEPLLRTKYVITVDADTQIPHGAARRMIGTMAHPLNQPILAGERQCVREGYAILQPRIGFNLDSAGRSIFSWMYASNPGIDPYAAAVSDVYQDLFGEGSFTGKGIYDVDAFEQVLAGTFPDNHILSHDLIEGCHARVGLVTDIELIDGFPSRYLADARRQHRWVRGDWQLLPWLGRTPPTRSGRRRNPLSGLSQWKIFDNLRRSLVAPTLLVWLVLGWFVLPGEAWVWTLAGLALLALPLLLQISSVLQHWPRAGAWGPYLRTLGSDLLHRIVQTAAAVTFLPSKAYLMGDAILRTLWRIKISKRRRLEWETAAAVDSRTRDDLWSAVRSMAFAPLFSLAILAILLASPVARESLPWAAGLLTLWFLSPAVAWWISRPIAPREYQLTSDDRGRLRTIARKTWGYFETFVTAEDHWLPPDNFQEYPEAKVAHRLSPTNEGLYLTSALAAWDCGFVGLHDFAALLERNLETLARLPMHRGHFYNWYETTTLNPLTPRYISTVDSGNLAACCLTLQQGLAELLTTPLWGEREQLGLRDSLALVQESIPRMHPPGARFVHRALDELEAQLGHLQGTLETSPSDLAEWWELAHRFDGEAALLGQGREAIDATLKLKHGELTAKLSCLQRHLQGAADDVRALLPWVGVAASGAAPRKADTPGAPPRLKWGLDAPRLQDAWRDVWSELNRRRSLHRLSEPDYTLRRALLALEQAVAETHLPAEQAEPLRLWHADFKAALGRGAERAAAAIDRFTRLEGRLEALAMDMDFRFLYNPQRRLFSIGFNLEEGRLDRSHYDMLMSEARLASLLAIAKGDVDVKHWFQLGRTLTRTASTRAMLSWGGTMFEYLMPALFTRLYIGSNLHQSCEAAVRRQVEYGQKHQIPWGISESAFGALNSSADYHYQSFGVPGLGLKRGLAKDLVISPYSTALACAIDLRAALENFQRLTHEGAEATWGYYDAIDFTPDRVPQGKKSVLVRCYMAHHHGMTMLALANCMFDDVMSRRFHDHPLPRATELLLQERAPAGGAEIQPHADEVAAVQVVRELIGPLSRRITTADTTTPLTHLISNGSYSVMVTNAGGGYSRCRDLDVTRWRSDTTCDAWGSFIYLRDVRSGKVWSAAQQPTGAAADAYEVVYSIDKAEFHRRDGQLETHLEVAVSPEHDAEVRQVKITNHGDKPVEIEITSYAEIVLASAAADLAHPAFHKLFIQTEYVPARNALLAMRRPRDASQEAKWAVHVLAHSEARSGLVEYETDRNQFVGRGRTPAAPQALAPGRALSGTVGAVLDPIFSLRTRLRVPPAESAQVAFITAVADSREAALNLADQYHDARVVHRTFELAWAQSQVELRHLHLSTANAHMYQRLAAGLLYPHGARRAASEVLVKNHQGQSGLWRYGVSGDHPLLLVRVSQPDQQMLVRELLVAHQYWHTCGLKTDLVILNEHPGSYLDEMQEQLEKLVRETLREGHARRDGIFLLRRTHVPDADVFLLEAAASISLQGERGALARQVETPVKAPPLPPPLAIRVQPAATPAEKPAAEPTALKLSNPLGGFHADGREYEIRLQGEQTTPAPWANVIANPHLGFLVTESGAGYTWARNSRENKLTSWSNDPVVDPPSEALYLRDNQSGDLWSPTPGPLRDRGEYRIRHGAGYSVFTHAVNQIESELTLSVAADDPVKFIRLKLHNRGTRPRQLSATYAVEWVLGVARELTANQVATQVDARSGAILATNTYHPEYANQTAFLQVLGRERTVTGDRGEFLGRNGGWRLPTALGHQGLSGRTGAGLDPFGAIQTTLRLAPNETTEVVFLLGQGANAAEAEALLARYASPEAVEAAQRAALAGWEETLEALQVNTPSGALDVLVNRWLLYQVLSCRYWGRSAFYQSGGAFGYRDQLQDVMALVFSRPELTRAHLVRAASRQFEPGDVQHWWHPPTGRGIRTKFSDDYLWLPFVTAYYLEATGDESLLDEPASFLRSPPLEPHEEERYELPEVADASASVYEHCLRALDHGLRFGPHGLPLIGCGDWNDGMNKVGVLGQGESVWVGWFLLTIFREFIPVIERRGEMERAARYRQEAERLERNMAEYAWDGQWYRRAYFDDGAPLGSAENTECQIDSLPQSWAVIAGADPHRAHQAMKSALERLVKRDQRLIQLFDPPFDKSPLDPGYIKGYLPGIRENGGQYTHAACWMIQACALQGHGQLAFELFDLINPVQHGSERGDIERYKVEPYVIAADVYAVSPHTGRGGWTWYTGSAAWMYRSAVESILGLQLRGDHWTVAPCIPASWPGFEMTYRRGAAVFQVTVDNPQAVERGVRRIALDGQEVADGKIRFDVAPGTHEVRVEMGG